MQQVRAWLVLVAICMVEREPRVHATTVDVHNELVATCKVESGPRCMHVAIGWYTFATIVEPLPLRTSIAYVQQLVCLSPLGS